MESENIALTLDSFATLYGYTYDYVMVFRVHGENTILSPIQKSFSMRSILQRLAVGGLEPTLYYSTCHDYVFCKLRASLERLLKEADRIKYKLELDGNELRKVAEKGYPAAHISPIFIEDIKNLSKKHPYTSIFAKYSCKERMARLYKKYGKGRIPLRSVDRLKLILNIMG